MDGRPGGLHDALQWRIGGRGGWCRGTRPRHTPFTYSQSFLPSQMGYRNSSLDRVGSGPRQSRRALEGCLIHSWLGSGLLQQRPWRELLWGRGRGSFIPRDACGVLGFQDFQSQVTFD